MHSTGNSAPSSIGSKTLEEQQNKNRMPDGRPEPKRQKRAQGAETAGEESASESEKLSLELSESEKKETQKKKTKKPEKKVEESRQKQDLQANLPANLFTESHYTAAEVYEKLKLMRELILSRRADAMD